MCRLRLQRDFHNLNYFHNMKIISQNKGFTLIETLVAIAVLMIAIAGPLTISNQALNSALYSRDQSIASALAQEEMEMIRNIKDNFIRYRPDDGGIVSVFSNCLDSTKHCQIESSQVSGIIGGSLIKSCSTYPSCPLYIGPDGSYTYNSASADQTTKFSRSFNISQLQTDPNDFQANISVTWNEGVTPNEVIIHSELSNSTRQ